MNASQLWLNWLFQCRTIGMVNEEIFHPRMISFCVPLTLFNIKSNLAESEKFQVYIEYYPEKKQLQLMLQLRDKEEAARLAKSVQQELRQTHYFDASYSNFIHELEYLLETLSSYQEQA